MDSYYRFDLTQFGKLATLYKEAMAKTPIEFAEKVLGIEPSEKQKAAGLPWYTPEQKKIFDAAVSNG